MILITGGAGFIGCNLSQYLLSKGEDVILFDNFSRLGSENNLAWLKKQNANGRLNIIQGDICDFDALKKAFPDEWQAGGSKSDKRAVFRRLSHAQEIHESRQPALL